MQGVEKEGMCREILLIVMFFFCRQLMIYQKRARDGSLDVSVEENNTLRRTAWGVQSEIKIAATHRQLYKCVARI